MFEFKGGLFVSFEGTEGSGKSTLMRELASLLEKNGIQVVSTREPGGSAVAEKIRNLILENAMDPLTELLLYEAARAEHLATKVFPALSRGATVLCDRFIDSTLAYQGQARGLNWKEVKKLNQSATSGLKPDLTVLIDIDPEEGLKRAQDPNRFENEGLEFQKKVRAGYRKARLEDSKRWYVLKPAKKSPEILAQEVWKEIQRRFARRMKQTKQFQNG